MTKFSIVAVLIIGVSGCSSAPKAGKGTSTTVTGSSVTASAKQVQQDLTTTETDLGKLESQTKFAK